MKVLVILSVVALLVGYGPHPALTQSINTKSLKAVQLYFRHGERVPDTSFQTATGGLTAQGKKRMYDLGVYFRDRYTNFIKTEFDETETSVISSDTDRAIRSGELAAYGLYRDYNKAANWNGDEPIPYEPIPIRTIPPQMDKYIQPKVPCPKLDELQISTVGDWLFNDFFAKNPRVLELYLANTDDKVLMDDNVHGEPKLVHLLSFFETLAFNSSNGIPMADWQKEITSFEDVRTFNLYLFRALNADPMASKLFGGPMLGLMVDNFQMEARNKMILYAGHDRAMYGFMMNLDIYDPLAPKTPPYGAAIFMELHEDGESTGEYVKMYFRNDSGAYPHEVKLKNCGSPCLFSEFVEKTKDLIPVDFEKECRVEGELENPESTAQSGNFGVIVVVAIAVIALVIISLVLVSKTRRSNYSAV